MDVSKPPGHRPPSRGRPGASADFLSDPTPDGREAVDVSQISMTSEAKSAPRLRQGYLPKTSNALLYRLHYLKMIFDPKIWRKESLTFFSSSIASLYATVLVCVYIAFSFTELVTYPKFKEYLEISGYFIYLFLVSNLYFLFVIYQVIVAKLSSVEKAIVIENEKSHGSLTIRIGAIIFGIGTFIYLSLQIIDFFEQHPDSKCYHVTKGINNFLMITFVVLQAFVIFTYPRLNFLWYQLINRYGTLHVVATNIILWIRTLIKESLEEITEIEHEHEMKDLEASNETHEVLGHTHSKCSAFLDAIKESERNESECNHMRHDILGDAIERTTPFLYPFIIEFALIGASVMFIMSNHIGISPNVPHLVPNKVRRPNVKKFLERKDLSHSIKGTVAGGIIMTIAIINLILFYGLDVHEHIEDASERLSKISNSFINCLGIIGLLIGLAEIQQLDVKPSNGHLTIDMDLDMTLLRFTSIFSFIYMIFTIITGAFNTEILNFPNELHIVNGCISIFQISLQIAFIESLKTKEMPKDKEFSKPGRQVTVFLFLYNLAQWLVYTFEVQKVRASLVEASFYGFMPWIIIQRVTLPLAVFFRFHSAVVFIELFKEVFEEPEEEELEVGNANGNQTRIEMDNRSIFNAENRRL